MLDFLAQNVRRRASRIFNIDRKILDENTVSVHFKQKLYKSNSFNARNRVRKFQTAFIQQPFR